MKLAEAWIKLHTRALPMCISYAGGYNGERAHLASAGASRLADLGVLSMLARGLLEDGFAVERLLEGLEDGSTDDELVELIDRLTFPETAILKRRLGLGRPDK